MKKCFLAVLLLLCISIPVTALETEYAISPQFDAVRDYVNGLALVTKNGESAIINIYGKEVLPYDTRVKRIRANGLIMVVGENDMAAFFDKYGNRKTEYIYDTYPVTHEKTGEKSYGFIYSLEEGDGKSKLVPFSRGKKYGYMDEMGREVVPPQYGFAGGFYDGIARIASMGILSPQGTYTNAKYGLILEDGREILSPDSYWVAGHTEGGYSYAANGRSDIVLAAPDGTVRKADARGFADIGLLFLFAEDAEGRRGIMKNDGQPGIPMAYYDCLEMTDRPAFIVNNKIIGYDNRLIFEAPEGITLRPHYLSPTEKSHLVLMVKAEGGQTLYGFVSVIGEVILKPAFESLFDMGEGLICARDRSGTHLYDYFGNYLCTLNGDNCGMSRDGLFPIQDYDTMKKGYMLNPLLCPKIFVNGEKISADVYPKIENDRTLVPFRAIFEKMGAVVGWEEETRTVSVKRKDITVSLQIGSETMYKNGTPTKIGVPAKIENDRTLVPLRAISEALDCNVSWDAKERTVTIRTDLPPDPPQGRPVKPFY